MNNNNNNGFSLLDLMVAVSIASILGAIGIINYSESSISLNKISVISDFDQDIRLAQLQSVNEGGRGILNIAANGESYSFGYDYLAYDAAAPITYDTLVFTTNLPEFITIASDVTIIFDSKGRLINEFGTYNSANITVYDHSSGSAQVFKTAVLSSSGVTTWN